LVYYREDVLTGEAKSPATIQDVNLPAQQTPRIALERRRFTA